MLIRHVASSTMDEVNVLSVVIGRFADACFLLLDQLVAAFTWLLHFLSDVGVSLCGSAVVEYWDFALFSFLSAAEVVCSAAHGTVHAMEAWLQLLGGVLESFKMAGHLFSHVAWRTKDVFQRGFTLACCVLRQTCEGVVIALSLVLYFVNTAVNVVLIATQNCLSVAVGVWETVAVPVHKVAELALTALTFLYSCVGGATVLLWTPCQLLLDFLGALGRVFITVFVVDSHGFLAAAAVVLVTVLLLNPGFPALVGRVSLRVVNTLPGVDGVRTTTRRLYAVMVAPALASRANTRTSARVTRTRPLNTDAAVLMTPADLLPPNAPRPPDSHQRDGELERRTSASSPNSAAGDGQLLVLLKEQEDGKKCVICQDQSKTVLLLPCRHLCLCRHCADILTQRRPLQQRCCPLCRRSITETMDVFL